MAALQISCCPPPPLPTPTWDLWGPLEFLKSPLISIKVWHVQGPHTAASSSLQRSQQILGNCPLFSLASPHFQDYRIFFLAELCFGFFFPFIFKHDLEQKGKKVLNYFLSLLNVLMESMYVIVHFPDEWESFHVGISFCEGLKPCHSLKVGLVLYPLALFLLCVSMYVCICIGGCMCAMMAIKVRGQLWHLSSPATFTWVPGPELRLQACIASTFTCSTTSVTS